MERTEHPPRSWAWGPFSATSWSVILYLAMIAAFAIPRLVGGGFHIPLYGPGEFIEGSYPMFWLVYVVLPLWVRDGWVCRKRGEPWSFDLKRSLVISVLATVAAYRFVFGWV